MRECMDNNTEFTLCGNNSLGTSAMYRKSSSSSNSSTSEAASPHGKNPSSSTFFDDSSSSASTSSPQSTALVPVVPKQEDADHCEHWKTLFPPGPKDIPKNVCPEKCDVCGDTSTGYHYEVASCNGCKTFFRRAVLGQRKFICKKGGECKKSMSKEVRVKCRSCRFERCVEAGMNPLAILSETNPGNNSIVREILSKRKMLPDSIENRPSTSREPFKLFVHPQLMENTMDRLIDELLHLEIAHERIRKSNYAPSLHDGLTMENCLKGHSKLGIDYGEAPPRVDHEKPHFEYIPFEVRIRDRIPFPQPPGKFCDRPKPKMWPFVDLVYTIEYLKTFDFFHKLDEFDKRALTKHITLVTVYITNSFYSYEHKSDCTVHPDGCSPHAGKILDWKEAEYERALHYETIQRIKKLQMDKKEYVLLKAVMACNPALEDLSTGAREIMQEQRDRYAKSLMSYVMARRGFLEGPSAYSEMMSHVDWLTRLVRKHRDIHVLLCALGLANRKFPPLMDEIFGA